jgi:hypothetical protein
VEVKRITLQRNKTDLPGAQVKGSPWSEEKKYLLGVEVKRITLD